MKEASIHYRLFLNQKDVYAQTPRYQIPSFQLNVHPCLTHVRPGPPES